MTNPTPHGQAPEALRLADALYDGSYLLSVERYTTADELRRLHAQVAALTAAQQVAQDGEGEVAEHYRNAIAVACEGWTMPDGLRKHLETALWTPPTPQPTQPQAGPISGAKSFQTYAEANAYSKGYYAGKKAAKQAQALNKRNRRRVEAFGVETSCADLAAQHGISERTMYRWAQISNDVTRQITDRHSKAKPQ